MNIAKKYVKKGNNYRIILRLKHYGNKFSDIDMLVKIAMNDFKGLSKSNISVMYYAGEHYAHTFGIEFDTTQIPASEYNQVNCVEYTF